MFSIRFLGQHFLFSFYEPENGEIYGSTPRGKNNKNMYFFFLFCLSALSCHENKWGWNQKWVAIDF